MTGHPRRRSVVALLCSLVGCGQTVDGNVSGEAGFLVVARHETHLAAITETSRTVHGYEVTTTRQGGDFTLHPAGGRPLVGQRATWVMLSKPGFEAYIGYMGGPASVGVERVDQGGRFQLEATRTYREERLAAWHVEREADPLCDRLTDDQCSLVRAHVAQRLSWLGEHYPEEAAAVEARRPENPFDIRATSWTAGPRAAIPLPGGALALIATSAAGSRLVVLDASDTQVGSIELNDEDPAPALHWSGETIAVYDGGAIKTFGPDLSRGSDVRLQPSLDSRDRVTSLALVDEGFLVGVQPATGAGRVRLYGPDGHRLEDRELPDVKRVLRVFATPDGGVMAHGVLVGPFDYDVRVGGMKKEDGMPRGLVRLADWGAEPEVLLTGVDSVAPAGDRLLAYARDLYAPEDHRLVLAGLDEPIRQVLVEVSWGGEVGPTHVVTDDRLGTRDLLVAPPVEDRLVLHENVSSRLSAATIAELDLRELGESAR